MGIGIAGERRLLFVGSGFSINLGMDRWEQLFEQVAKGRPIEHIVSRHLACGSPYKAAETLRAHLGREALEKQIRRLVRRRQDSISKEEANRWIVPLSKIASNGGVVTTNWDTLLPDITGWDALRWPEDRKRLITALKSNQPFVLFLHGNINKGPLVLTESDRADVEKELRQPKNDLSQLLASYEKLILGFGFRDPHIENLFLAAEEFSGDSDHLRVFIKSSDVPEFQAKHPLIARRAKLHRFRDHDALRYRVEELASECDPSASLLSLPDVTLQTDFFDIVSEQSYGFRTAERIRAAAKKNPRMLDWSAEYLLQSKWTDKHAGTFAVVLSGLMNRWNPSAKELRGLNRRCATAKDEPEQIAVLEPVAFALADKGLPDHHAAFLSGVVRDMEMRRVHVQQSLSYYRETVEQISAVERHMGDDRRNGIRRANDVARLLTLLESKDPAVTSRVLPLLHRSVRILHKAKEDKLAKAVECEVFGIRREYGI